MRDAAASTMRFAASVFLCFSHDMKRSLVARAVAAWALFVTSGCGLEPLASCPQADLRSGLCCDDWSAPEGGRCVVRRWRPLHPSVTLGEFASKPSVDIDLGGRVWLAYEEAHATESSVILARETPAGWDLTSPSLGLGGQNQEARVAAVDDEHSVVAWLRTGVVDLQTVVSVGVKGGSMVEPPGGGLFSFAPWAYQHEALAHADGELAVTWNQGLDAGHRRGICIATREAGASEWKRPKNQLDVLSRSFIFSNNPEFARNDAGDMVVTWFESIGEKLRVMPSERYGLSGPFTVALDEDALSPPEGDVENPETAVAEDGRAVIVWRQVMPDGRMAAFLSERPNRGAWSRPTIDEPFGPIADNAWNTRVAFARTGDLYVVWEQKDGDDWSILLAHRDASGKWIAPGSSPLRLSAQPAIEPVLRVAADGTVVVMWRARVGAHFRVVARRSSVHAEGATEAERWSSADVLSEDGQDAGTPALAVARDATERGHRFVAAWSWDGRIVTSSLD